MGGVGGLEAVFIRTPADEERQEKIRGRREGG